MPDKSQKFKTWDPDDGEEGDAKTIDHMRPEWAAEVFAEQRYQGDPSEFITVLVRDETGALYAFEVQAIPEVRFSAGPLRTGKVHS